MVLAATGAALSAPALAAGDSARASTALADAVVSQAGVPLQAAGKGRLKFWGLEVYDAALWVSPGFRASDFARQPFALELHYLRSFTAREIARASIEQMRRHGSIDDAQASRWQTRLTEVLPDVRRGDRLVGLHRPGIGAAFFHNGRPVGEVAEAAFARLFFAIWLGEATSAPELRRALVAAAAP